VPEQSPRTVSIIGVNGWYSANHCIGNGIDSGGTNPLPKNGSAAGAAAAGCCAVSTLFEDEADRNAPAGECEARDRRSCRCAGDLDRPVVGRKPVSTATA
jgi:hypothetical protein